jgi:hypothetical protein
LALKSGRPVYAIVLVALSTLFMAATFLPFLYSILSPNLDIERFVAALKDSDEAPLDPDSVVEQTKGAVGSLTRVIQIGYYSETSIGFHLSGSRAPEHIHTSQATYIAWFQRHPKPMLVSVTLRANDEGQKAYGISEVAPITLVRGYGVPVALFGAALFLVRKRKSPGATD